MQYDFILGLGRACSCSQTLRAAGLQLLSLPFDWIGWAYERDLPYRAELLCDDFTDWIRKEDLAFIRSEGPLDRYLDRRTQTMIYHDFPKGVPFDEQYPRVIAKYERRIKRMYRLIESSKRVLLVRIDRPCSAPGTPLEDCRDAWHRISARFPNVKFDFCLMAFEAGRSLEDRKVETLEEGFTRITLDYHDYSPGSIATSPNLDVSAAAMRALYSVCEYRTADEIRQKDEKKMQARWARYGAHNAFQYRIRKLKADILKRFSRA